MPHCPHCGAALDQGLDVCPACGARLESPAPPEAAEPPRRRYPGRKVVLTFLAIIAAVAVLFMVGLIYFIRHTTIVTSGTNGGRVESPYGVVTTSNNPEVLAKSLGLDLYPGAVGENGAKAELASSNMVSLRFSTHDPPRRVIHFYHIRYPDATVKVRGAMLVLVQVGLRDTLTIKARPQSGHTEIEISDIQH